MGKVTRKRYAAEFKSRVALEAIRGELTLAELASKHGVHQTMIAQWKRQAIDADFFCDGVDGSQRHRDVPR